MSAGSFTQPADVLFQLFVLDLLIILATLHIFQPGRITASADLYAITPQRHDMIRAGIQHLPVMTDEDEPAFAFQICRHQRSGAGIQMIGRLVDQLKAVLIKKQRCQLHLGLLPL